MSAQVLPTKTTPHLSASSELMNCAGTDEGKVRQASNCYYSGTVYELGRRMFECIFTENPHYLAYLNLKGEPNWSNHISFKIHVQVMVVISGNTSGRVACLCVRFVQPLFSPNRCLSDGPLGLWQRVVQNVTASQKHAGILGPLKNRSDTVWGIEDSFLARCPLFLMSRVTVIRESPFVGHQNAGDQRPSPWGDWRRLASCASVGLISTWETDWWVARRMCMYTSYTTTTHLPIFRFSWNRIGKAVGNRWTRFYWWHTDLSKCAMCRS